MAADRPAPRLSVLVTRPAGAAADSLCQAVRASGCAAYQQPLLELQPLDELSPGSRTLLLDLDRYAHIIFISGNAVRFGMGCIEDYWPQLPVGLHWYAIGAATAAQLETFGVHAQTPGKEMTSEGLLELPSLQQIAGERVLVVKGEGGRDTLRRELSGRGAQVDELPCYRRALPDLPPGALARRLAEPPIDTVLVSSGEGLANMQRLLSPAETSNVYHLNIVVPSQRVAAQARDAGFRRVITAENASDAAMVRALEDCTPPLETE